eukprot:TRINITY_DN35773_c0_g1_i2.p1 TRINITY_DN35773_c0_g1~~TRINITY_DN35773_c0_g1_i2.p1  ORF type:complete len:457 (-),score=107.33 TRINITY_DN35773_c0_g1_i2:343-1713(-)
MRLLRQLAAAVLVSECYAGVEGRAAADLEEFSASNFEDLASELSTPQGSDFNEYAAKQFAQYARASFCATRSIKAWACGDICNETEVQHRVQTEDEPSGPAVKIIEVGEISGVSGYVAILANIAANRPLFVEEFAFETHCVVAFRGAVNEKNWEIDAQLLLTDWPPDNRSDASGNETWCEDCQAHEGFSKTYEELRDRTLGSIESLGCKVVQVVGYALGGAVATLGAMDLASLRRVPRVKLWTYGSPRVGNKQFAQTFAQLTVAEDSILTSWRIVHHKDPVVEELPPKAYQHVPQEIYYNSDFTEHTACQWSMEKLESKTCDGKRKPWSAVASVTGTVGGDHNLYMNKSFQLKEFNADCRPENNCRDLGYIPMEESYVWIVGSSLLSFLLGGCSVSCCQRRMAHKARMAGHMSFSTERSIGQSTVSMGIDLPEISVVRTQSSGGMVHRTASASYAR